MDEDDKKNEENDDLEDLLEKNFEIQDEIHPRCKISDNHEERIKKWNAKYGKK
ncbi:MAG: hypothetical protein ACFFAO_21465 [Candidatus Hermodarchaeota archaeon]